MEILIEGGRRKEALRGTGGVASKDHSMYVAQSYCNTSSFSCRMFYIDNSPSDVSKEDQQRLNVRAQRFASERGNKSFKKRLSVADLVQAVVSMAAILASVIII